MLAKENRFGSVVSGFFTPTANRIVTEFASFLSAEFPLFFYDTKFRSAGF